MELTVKHEVKSCPRCGAAFECKAGTILQCQCYGIAINDEESAYMMQRYEGCLCRNCLQAIPGELALFREKFIFGKG